MFSSKVVLITDASSVIGAATALNFAKLGATLSLIGNNTKTLEDVGATCVAAGAQKPLLITADLGNDEDVRRVIDVTIETFHKLDVVVNNVCIVQVRSTEDADVHQHDRVFETTVRSNYLLATLAIPHLIETNGNIISVADPSKEAMDQLARCTAIKMAPKQVTVNSANPGVVVISEFHRRCGMDEEQYRQFLERPKTRHVLGRVGQPDVVARSIALVASDDASFSTGGT